MRKILAAGFVSLAVFSVFPALTACNSTGVVESVNKKSFLDDYSYSDMTDYEGLKNYSRDLKFKDVTVKDVDKAMLTTDNIIAVVFGVIAAAVVGYFSIVLFKWLLKTDKMIVFIIYTAVVGLIVTGISVFEMLNNTTVKFF